MDGIYSVTSYNENRSPVFSHGNFVIFFSGGYTCGGKWILTSSDQQTLYGEWLGSIESLPMGTVYETHNGLSPETEIIQQ